MQRTAPSFAPSRLIPSLVCAALAPSFCAAQTGPFTDGELLVRASSIIFQPETLYRVDPVTGVAAALVTEITPGYSDGGWMEYDRYRDTILAYCAWGPLGTTAAQLFRFDSDGAVTSLGFLGEKIRALAPVGDGRVYCYQDKTLSLLDAANGLTPVLDEFGLEIDLPIDHMVYDPATNSLIGVGRTSTGCGAFKDVPIHRLPLAADGLSVEAPIACNTYMLGSGVFPIGLDHLPGGTLLLTMVGGTVVAQDRLLEIDPVTLTASIWAQTPFSDLNGGAWVPALGGVVVLEDGDDELRLMLKGQSGEGIVIPTTEAMGNGTSGVSTANSLTDIDLTGPGCGGLAKAFGAGHPGAGGETPLFGAASCPASGSILPLTVANGVGGGAALLLLGLSGGALPIQDGTLYVLPPFAATIVLPLSGSPGQVGAGFGQSNVLVPSAPGLVGIPIYGQALVVDGAASAGYSFSKGLELRIG